MLQARVRGFLIREAYYARLEAEAASLEADLDMAEHATSDLDAAVAWSRQTHERRNDGSLKNDWGRMDYWANVRQSGSL